LKRQAIHAGDADRRQQRADRGRDQRHEQRHQDHHRDRTARIGCEARDGGDRDHEDDRQAGEQDVQRDLVRRLLPPGTFHQRDHAIQEGGSLGCGDAHLDPIGQHAGAAGDRRTIATALADHRCGLTGDRRLVDRGDAFDHIAVARDQVAGLDQHDVALFQLGGGDRLPVRGVLQGEALGSGLGARPAQRRCLRLAAAFGHRLGEVGEQHGHPQPDDDLEGETHVLAAAGDERADKDDRGGAATISTTNITGFLISTRGSKA
jgi:hypothetical protein